MVSKYFVYHKVFHKPANFAYLVFAEPPSGWLFAFLGSGFTDTSKLFQDFFMNGIEHQPADLKPSNTARQHRFALGQIVATPAVIAHFNEHRESMQFYLRRHVCGDWGEVCADDWAENDLSVKQGFRILSAYTVATEKIWVVTEADRSATTLLFPSEY